MEVLNKVYDYKIYNLKDFIIECGIINNSDYGNTVDCFKNVLLFIDRMKCPEMARYTRNCSVTWTDMKDAFMFSHLGKDLGISEVPYATRKVNQQLQCYLSCTNLLYLFYSNAWNDLYNLIGTEFMKFIIFQSSLFLPLSNNSYVALHKERTLRVLNNHRKPYIKNVKCRKFVSHAEQAPSTSDNCVNTEKNCNSKVLGNKNKTKKKAMHSRYGYNSSLILNLRGIMYNRSGLKKVYVKDTININTDYNKGCQYLLDMILKQDVGVIMDYSIVDLTQMKVFLQFFIKRTLALGKCRIIMESILEAQCSNDEILVNGRKRKLVLDIDRSIKKRRLLTQISPRFSMVSSKKRRKVRLYSLESVSLTEVRKLIAFIMRKILLKKFFGAHNHHIINNFLSILKYGKNQVFELGDLMKNIDIMKIELFKNIKSLGIKWNLLAKFLVWLLKFFLFPVLCKHFYITESRRSFNKLQYYKKKHWQILKNCVIYNFVNSGRWIILTKKLKQITDVMNLETCNVRFLPKRKFGVRPIIWRKRNMLAEAQILLLQLCGLNTKSNVFNNLDKFYKLWLSMCLKWKTANKCPLYFVKVDICDAYGSMKVGKLKTLLENIIWRVMINESREVQVDDLHDVYLTLRELKCFHNNNNSLSCRIINRFDELPSCIPSNSIIVPTEKVQNLKVIHLLSIIAREIYYTTVAVGNKKYCIAKGVTQGGRLSSALCRLYYDHIDFYYLSAFRKNPADLLVRAVDDYLYVTPDLDRAKAFLTRMEQGFCGNSCFINKSKTITNWGQNPVASISFYGLVINTNSMEISGNYECYKEINIFHTISFRSLDHPGQFLSKRMKFMSSLKLNKVFLDPVINSKKTILLNVLRASLLMAFRFHAIVANIFKSYNSTYLINCIEEFAGCVASRVVRVAEEQSLPENCNISISMAVWIVYRAFFLKLNKELENFACYESILNFLKHKFIILFSQLIKDDQDLLRSISKYSIKDDFKGTE